MIRQIHVIYLGYRRILIDRTYGEFVHIAELCRKPYFLAFFDAESVAQCLGNSYASVRHLKVIVIKINRNVVLIGYIRNYHARRIVHMISNVFPDEFNTGKI